MTSASIRERCLGGYDFLADPNERADQTDVFWRPSDYSSVVVLTTTLLDEKSLPFAPAEGPGRVVRRDADDGAHIVIEGGEAKHQIWLPHPPPIGTQVSAAIPLNATTPARIDAVRRFLGHVMPGTRRGRPAPRPRRVDRLTRALRALDGRMAGASYRAVATRLFGGHRVAEDPWKTSPVRDTVIRLVRTGVLLMKGGYRHLLKPRHRD
jgi:hypothetical protein